jgi:hypothetical protein
MRNVTVNGATIEDVQEILEVDSSVFPQEYWIDEKDLLRIFAVAGTESCRIAKYNGQIIGYYSMLPMNKEGFSLMMSGKINEKEMYKYIIPYNENDSNYIYMASIVAKRPTLCGRPFLHDFYNRVKEIHNIYGIESIGGLAVSKEGERLAKGLGMRIMDEPISYGYFKNAVPYIADLRRIISWRNKSGSVKV